MTFFVCVCVCVQGFFCSFNQHSTDMLQILCRQSGKAAEGHAAKTRLPKIQPTTVVDRLGGD